MPYSNREQQKKAVRKRQNHMRLLYQEYKESQSCADCGKYYPYYVMQFDHVRGEKKFTLATRSASFGSKKFMDELKKCDLVCANCHMIREHM